MRLPKDQRQGPASRDKPWRSSVERQRQDVGRLLDQLEAGQKATQNTEAPKMCAAWLATTRRSDS